ncbi:MULTISPECIES: restriction endonuclease [Streptomyces albovinaceus subgroup]|uniref:nSTAND3 domain-containing NTPase n=1 Tax=Streptomyces albovinaceus subgroup TaxID=1482558 RepID=UPI00131E3580|nr:restriction endonuclease [Streptomyces mediolani]
MSPDYDFKDLSPYDFEALIRDLLSVHEQLAFSTYRVGPDGGIDLQARKGKLMHIAQCKHTPDASRVKLKRMAAQEKGKLPGVAQEIERYIFITSADLTPAGERELWSELTGCAQTVEVHGRGWLNALLALHPEVERRHFKLWIKSSVAIREMLNGGVFLRGESRARRIERNYLRFVHHEICDVAEKSLERNGVAILKGSPGAGKTAVAEYLILQWWRRGFRVIVDPRTVDSWWEWLEDDTPSIFFFDDAWGQTRLHDHALSHHDKDLAEFLTSIIEKNARLENGAQRCKVAVVTSRSLVLHDTKRFSDATSALLDAIPESVIAVERLTAEVKSRILFNHVNIAVADRQIRKQLAASDWWTRVAAHPNYSPRIVEIVTSRPHFTSGGQLVDEIHEALNDPQQIWQSSFEALSPVEQLLLAVLAVSDSQGVRRDIVTARLHDYSATEVGSAIRRLAGAWIERSRDKGSEVYSLSDPSQRDFLTRYLAREPLACLDLIKHCRSYEDIRVLCKLGRPQELEYQQSLFSIDEISLRESLDECTAPLLSSLRTVWAQFSARPKGVPKGLLTVSMQSFVDLFSTFIEIVVFHADRYMGSKAHEFAHDGWVEAGMERVLHSLDETDFTSFFESMDAVGQIYYVYSDLTRYRVFEGPYAQHIDWIRQAIMTSWTAWDSAVMEMYGESDYWSELVEAVIDQTDQFEDIGFPVGAAYMLEDLQSFDEEVSYRIEADAHGVDWVSKLDELEELFDCKFEESRKTLKVQGLVPEDDSLIEEVIAFPRGVDSTARPATNGYVTGAEALFRSLGDAEAGA